MCTKTGLILSLRSYYQHNQQSSQIGYSVFHTTPTTFIIKQGFEDIEFQKFMNRYKAFEKGKFEKELIPMKHCIQNLWLIKPGNQNQGRGIVIYKSLNEIINFFQNKSNNQQWIIQKYIEKPLLFKNRKFDIRMWALITCKNEVFFYLDGYMRTSGDTYQLDSCSTNIHLTNNFQQKYFANYGQYEPGNTLPIERLFEYISPSNLDQRNKLKDSILARMKDVIIDAYLASRKNMVQQKKYQSYELFGYDFLVDEDLRVWLLEINSNPYLGTPNDDMKDLIPKMIEELLDIILRNKNRKNHRFELIYSEQTLGGWSDSLASQYERQSFNISLYPSLQQQNISFCRNENNPSLCKTVRQEFYGAPQTLNKTNLLGRRDDELAAKQIYQHLNFQIQNYSIKDQDPYQSIFSTILTKINNWKEQDQKELKWHQKSLKLIIQSNIKLLFLEQEYYKKLFSILLDDLPEQIELLLLEASYEICKIILNKRKLLNEKFINLLCKLLYEKSKDLLNRQKRSNENDQGHNYPQIELLAKSLSLIGGQFDRKQYIPGETQIKEKSRIQFLQCGGLVVFYYLSQIDCFPKPLASLVRQLLDSLNHQDFQYQNQLLEQWEKQKQKNDPCQSLLKNQTDDFKNCKENIEIESQKQIKNKTRIANILIHNNSRQQSLTKNGQEKQLSQSYTNILDLKSTKLSFNEKSRSNDDLDKYNSIPVPNYLYESSLFQNSDFKDQLQEFIKSKLEQSPFNQQQQTKIKFMSQQKVNYNLEDKQLPVSVVPVPNIIIKQINKSASPSRQSDRKEANHRKFSQRQTKTKELSSTDNSPSNNREQNQIIPQINLRYKKESTKNIEVYKNNEIKELSKDIIQNQSKIINNMSPIKKKYNLVENHLLKNPNQNVLKDQQYHTNLQPIGQPRYYLKNSSNIFSPKSQQQIQQKNKESKQEFSSNLSILFPQSQQIQSAKNQNNFIKVSSQKYSNKLPLQNKQNLQQQERQNIHEQRIRSSPIKKCILKQSSFEVNATKYVYDVDLEVKQIQKIKQETEGNQQLDTMQEEVQLQNQQKYLDNQEVSESEIPQEQENQIIIQ